MLTCAFVALCVLFAAAAAAQVWWPFKPNLLGQGAIILIAFAAYGCAIGVARVLF